ncbi:TniQ family protein [Aeromonas dhakensis]|uniref:TniQ family protein n=1 Tax=Aeromonas dhakensis TaxID=196024 RepID=UPI003B9DEF65
MILHRLELLPGEHLGAVVGRMHVLSTHGTLTATAKAFGLSRPPTIPHRLCHANDIALTATFRAHGTSQIWQTHGYGHYLAPFLTPLEQRMLALAFAGQAPLQLRVTGLYIVQHRYWRWCSDCLVEDYETHGMPYYHRDHQLPGVFHCHRHQRGLSGRCTDCGFEATVLLKQPIPPYDNKCSNCGHWMAGYDGHFTELMREIELVSHSLAQSASSLTLSLLTGFVKDAMRISANAAPTHKIMKSVSAWFKDMDVNCDPQALALYFRNTDTIGRGLRMPPQLRNVRGYHAQATEDPLHPLIHLLILQNAGVDLMGLLGSGG